MAGHDETYELARELVGSYIIHRETQFGDWLSGEDNQVEGIRPLQLVGADGNNLAGEEQRRLIEHVLEVFYQTLAHFPVIEKPDPFLIVDVWRDEILPRIEASMKGGEAPD